MSSLRSARRVLAALVLAALVGPSPVRADARTEARRHFRRGMELVVDGRRLHIVTHRVEGLVVSLGRLEP